MKFVLAPDKYKGSLTGLEICEALENGLRKVFPDCEILKMPMADGGDGTIEVVRYYLKANTVKVTVSDPLFRSVIASYLYATDTKIAYIEMAEASGLRLLNDHEKNCKATTSLGTGQLIDHAIKNGAKGIILGIGGSATNDAGMGMATALGYRFLDKEGKYLLPIGSNLIKVSRIDATRVSPDLKKIGLKVACDVTNPFYGPKGAAHVYARQKGASEEDVALLDEGLRSFAQILKEQFHMNVQEISGAGAAGGLGAATMVFLKGHLSSGIELIKELAQFDANIKDADWILTGEGRLDDQTLSGKAIQGVLTSAKKQRIPVAAFCGSVDISESTAKKLGLAYVNAVSENMPNLEEALKHSYKNLVAATEEFAKGLHP
jgi:glycerate kinase